VGANVSSAAFGALDRFVDALTDLTKPQQYVIFIVPPIPS
jgi:hypothetical protein